MQHDLRTPLNVVIGFSEAMLRELHGPLGHARYQEYAAHISESGGRLLKASEDALAVAATMSALLAAPSTPASQEGCAATPRQSYRDLPVWQEAMRLAELCYRHTQGFPEHERSGLTARIRRAAASIPASIAEGYGRESSECYVQLLRIAQGSCKELETHVLLASRVLDEPASAPGPVLDRAAVVGRMLRELIRSLQCT